MRFASRLFVGVAAAAVLVPAAFAQTGPDVPPDNAGDSGGDVVIVTGIGPARASDELIANTTSLSAEALTERLSGGLGDTLAGLPGISSSAFGPGASRPIIRGLGAERVQVLANGIGVVDASAASPDHATTSDPLGAERIEILRGPASLAYGGGATGGVVNVIDGLIVESKPDRDFSGSLYGALTSADEGKQVAGRVTSVWGDFVSVVNASQLKTSDVDIPGFALTSAARAQAILDGVDPATFANGTLPNSAVDTKSISAGLTWVGDGAFLGGAVRQLDNEYGTVAEPDVFIQMNQMRYDLRSGLMFNDGWLKSIIASGSKVDYEHTEFEGPGQPGTVFTNEGWEARVEAQHTSLTGFEGSVGVQSSEHHFAAIGDESVIGPTNSKSTGVFIYETLDQGMWGLEGGLRYDTVAVDNIVGGKRSFEPWNASFGAHLHLSDHVFLGASVASTERAPTDLELFANGPHLATAQFLVGDSAIDTEKGINTELTARWEDEDFNVSGSVYRFDFSRFNYLRDTGVVDMSAGEDLPVFQYTQAGATFTGFELQADAKLGTAFGIDWKTDGAADFVRAELDSGGNLPLIPPMTVNAGIEGEMNGVTGRIQAQYAAKQVNNASFEQPTDSYTSLDARLGFDIVDGVHLILEGRNLTNEEVRLHTSPLKEIAPMTGRNFRVAIRADF
jgi:iron complex outermembrane receptor protein